MTNSIITIVISLISGGVLGAFAKSFLDKRYHRFSELFALKQTRYKATIIMMWTAMNPTKENFKKLQKIRSDIQDKNDLENELQLELHNAMLFASNNVLKTLEAFINNKSLDNWKRTTSAMRKDLYK